MVGGTEMNVARVELKLWLIGLAAFAVVIALSAYLRANSIGIVEHQLAGTAERVNEIQAQWRADGMRGWAIVGMLSDLVFIGIYGVGAWIAGRSLAASGGGLLKAVGWVAAIAGAVFLLTDYVETILQVVQLIREAGSDGMAGTAAAMQTPKTLAWIVSFLGVIIGLVVRRFVRP